MPEPHMDKYKIDKTLLGWNFCMFSFASLIFLILYGDISKLFNNSLSKQKLVNMSISFLPLSFKIVSAPLLLETKLSFCFLSLFGCLTINLLFSAKFWCLGIWNSLSGQQAHLSRYSRYYYTFTLTRLHVKLYRHPDFEIKFDRIEHLMKIIN